MPDEMDELEEDWWASLTDEQREAVLAVDFEHDDVPGWIVASLVAAHSADGAGDEGEPADDIRPRVIPRLQALVERKRSEGAS